MVNTIRGVFLVWCCWCFQTPLLVSSNNNNSNNSNISQNTGSNKFKPILLGFSNGVPNRFDASTSVDVEIFAIKGFNTSQQDTTLDIECKIDSIPRPHVRIDTQSFRLSFQNLNLGVHTLDIMAVTTNNNGDDVESEVMQYSWEIVDPNPDTSIRNQPTSVMGGIAEYTDGWLAHVGVSAAASSILCRLTNVSFDSWSQCCDDTFAISTCVDGCKSGDSPPVCAVLDSAFVTCAASKSVSGVGSMQGEGEWATCSPPIDPTVLGNNDASYPLAGGQRYLLEVKSVGITKQGNGSVASWEWSVLPPRFYNSSVSYENVSSSSSDSCSPIAQPALTTFAVVSWILIIVVMGLAYVKRETLVAGWNPTKARMANLEKSQRKLEIKMPNQIKFSVGKTVAKNSSSSPNRISPVQSQQSFLTPVAPPRQKKAFSLTMPSLPPGDNFQSIKVEPPSPTPVAVNNPVRPKRTKRQNATATSSQSGFGVVKRHIPSTSEHTSNLANLDTSKVVGFQMVKFKRITPDSSREGSRTTSPTNK